MFTIVAMKMLEAAGYQVTPTDIPGLWDVQGLANDVTLGQLRQLAEQHGKPWERAIIGPTINFQQIN